jgi:hypothetical protein
MDLTNQTHAVTYDDIKIYVDRDFGDEVDDDVNLLPPGFTPDDIRRLIDTIATKEDCPAVRNLTFSGQDDVSIFCRRVSTCINMERANQEPEGIVR